MFLTPIENTEWAKNPYGQNEYNWLYNVLDQIQSWHSHASPWKIN